MNDFDTGWLAGLIDGEGNISRGTVRVTSTDLDILEKARRVSGAGDIVARSADSRGRRKPSYVWQVLRKRDALPLLAAVLPHLCTRKAQLAAYYLYREDQIDFDTYHGHELRRLDELRIGR